MKFSLASFSVCLCITLCTASYAPVYHRPGFTRGPHGISAVYRNDLRQIAVNHRAEAVGASDGTADFYGVPGAGRYVVDNRYGYGQGYAYRAGYGAGYGYPHEVRYAGY